MHCRKSLHIEPSDFYQYQHGKKRPSNNTTKSAKVIEPMLKKLCKWQMAIVRLPAFRPTEQTFQHPQHVPCMLRSTPMYHFSLHCCCGVDVKLQIFYNKISSGAARCKTKTIQQLYTILR